jgi:hypothetical protein
LDLHRFHRILQNVHICNSVDRVEHDVTPSVESA